MLEIEGLNKLFLSSTLEKCNTYINLVFDSMEKPFSYLEEYLKKVKESLLMSYTYEQWNYVLEPSTNMEVLSVGKDSKALENIDKLLEELYK